MARDLSGMVEVSIAFSNEGPLYQLISWQASLIFFILMADTGTIENDVNPIEVKYTSSIH